MRRAPMSLERVVNENAATLRELVEVLNDGRKFYEEAAAQARADDLKLLFGRMARTKGAIAGALNARIEAHGSAAPADGTLAGMLRKAYAEVRACLSNTPDEEYVGQLEGFEDRIISVFRSAVGESDDPEVRAVASKYLPDVMRDHSEMSALKHQLSGH
jgi:uncharacterized protein (TIGR02284 family)